MEKRKLEHALKDLNDALSILKDMSRKMDLEHPSTCSTSGATDTTGSSDRACTEEGCGLGSSAQHNSEGGTPDTDRDCCHVSGEQTVEGEGDCNADQSEEVDQNATHLDTSASASASEFNSLTLSDTVLTSLPDTNSNPVSNSAAHNDCGDVELSTIRSETSDFVEASEFFDCEESGKLPAQIEELSDSDGDNFCEVFEEAQGDMTLDQSVFDHDGTADATDESEIQTKIVELNVCKLSPDSNLDEDQKTEGEHIVINHVPETEMREDQRAESAPGQITNHSESEDTRVGIENGQNGQVENDRTESESSDVIEAPTPHIMQNISKLVNYENEPNDDSVS